MTRFLISNDDGIDALGINLLAEIASEVGRVQVVAPDREQSATSHALTLLRPLRAIPRGAGRFAVDGTPTDCVLLALGTLLDDPPDFVLSGINHGPNMGEDVLYSGTVAAAMEGLAAGIPSVALSFASRDTQLLPGYRETLVRILSTIVRVESFPVETLLNVNIPPVPADEVRGVRVTSLGTRVFSESVRETTDPWGRALFWVGGGRVSWSGGEDTDFGAVDAGYISVTPLHVDLTNYRLLEEVRSWGLGT